MRTANRRLCGCDCPEKSATSPLQTTDAEIVATFEEIALIKDQLGAIEQTLAKIFGEAYSRDARSLQARRDAGDLIERHFDGIVEQWTSAVDQLRGSTEDHQDRRQGFANALIRFIWHLQNPEDLRTYVYLRRHCQQGDLAKLTPARFNIVHIALKQIILDHVRSTMRGHAMELVRDAVVAAIDERRLMVAQFYIESREVTIRASEEKYRASIDHAPDPMYEVEPGTWRLIGANSAAVALSEHTRRVLADTASNGSDTVHPGPSAPLLPPLEDLKNGLGELKLTDLVPPEMREETIHHLETVVRNGTDETLDLPMSGRYFDISSALIPYGSKQFIQIILHDVTQRREMLDELLKAERLAAAGTFAAGVAHEVNNPLASISSLVQSLLSGESDPGRRMSLHTILSQITRISGTLKDLVNFARPSTSQRRPVSLNDIVSETLRLVTYNKRFRGITLEPVLAPDLKLAFVDDNEIQQVLLNLLFNAADAIPHEGGVIRVSTENKIAKHDGDRAHRVVMKVTDNGIGIPAEHQARVFDPFFTTKPAGSGVGLGLSLCQRIIIGNHGAIKLESQVGKGTTVAIWLPAYEAEAARPSAAAQ